MKNSGKKNNKKILPSHVAVIMDGNGRWANKRFMPRTAGHKSGVKSTRRMVELCALRGIESLTVFAFSSENWSRPETEVSSLMSLFVSTLNAELHKLHEKGVRIRFIGDRSRFPEKLQESIQNAETRTAGNRKLNLNVAANYGGRWDIANACRSLAEKVATNEMKPDDINEKSISAELSLSLQPDPDLLIRTGGEQRISNFLLWQSAYTEFYFTETLWPDFDDAAFNTALEWYSSRQRRFGKTGKQIEDERARTG